MERENIIWKWVVGYEGLYKVSSKGEIYSIIRGKMLKQFYTGGGYRRVQIWKDGEGRFVLVHRIVAEAFVPNPDNMKYVNHKDEDKDNNSVENLEWCSASYNNSYGSRKGMFKSLKWYTNGVENVRMYECPPGYHEGRTPMGYWFNNGVVNVRRQECPKGFVKGKIKRKTKV